MQLESFYSLAMGEPRQYGIILPPDYEQHPNQTYPVIVLLHGGNDGVNAYVDSYGIISVLQQLYSTGELPSAIVVMPDGNDHRGQSVFWDPEYFDGPNGNVATLIGSELVQQIKTHYRASSDPQLWALGGISSGGWGAFNIGLHHLDQFHILFSHSGYFTDESGPQNSPQDFIQQLPAEQLKSLHVYLDAGENALDAMMRDSTMAFQRELIQLGVDTQFQIFPGGHGSGGEDTGWNYFHQRLFDSLAFVGQQFNCHAGGV